MSSPKTIARVVGTRPQFMQMKPLSEELERRGYNEIRIHTGQHYSDDLFANQVKALGLPELHHNLKVGSSSHGEMFGRMFPRLEALYQEIKPDAVLADGDTNSTFAAIFAAQRIGIPTIHAEGGLRDFDRARPEELNRILSDHTADLNCAPVPRALRNLEAENLAHRSVLCGDLLLDNFLLNEKAHDPSILEDVFGNGGHVPDFLAMTLHRPENTDMDQYDRFGDIMKMLDHAGLPVVFPVHPRTRPILDRYEIEHGLPSNLICIPAVNYAQMLTLIRASVGVVTDSGGLPREACWIGRPVLMLFRVDTWHDLMESKLAILGHADGEALIAQYETMRTSCRTDATAARELFGNGQASARIVDAIKDRIFT